MLPLLIVSALTAATALAQDATAARAAQSHSHSAYERLFTVAPIPVTGAKQKKPQPGEWNRRPRHVEVFSQHKHTMERGPCNMPIIVGDASADPGILIPRKHTETPRIRVAQAPACRDK